MPRSRLTSPLRAFAAVALAGIVSVALPGLAAAQGWDWDEDVAPTLDPSLDLSDCADSGLQLETWLQGPAREQKWLLEPKS